MASAGPRGWRWASAGARGARPLLGVPRLVVVTLTGAAFIALRSAGWLGTAPLLVIMAILLAGGVVSEVSFRVARARGGFGWLIVLPLAAVTAVIYSIGWGPALTIGYLYPIGEAFRLKRPPPIVAVFATLAAGLTVGEIVVEENGVHSYVPTPYAHGLAALGLLGLFAVYQMLVAATHSIDRANAASARREESFRLLFANHPNPMWVYDEETLEILAVNDAAVERYGYSEDDFLSMRIINLRPTEELPRLAVDLAGPRKDFSTSNGWRHLLADGTMIDVEISSHRTQYLGRDAVLVSAVDVTERNRLEGRLRHQAFHDDLTGLPNRAYLNEQLGELEAAAYASGQAIAVFVIDLDDFYQLNSAMGFGVGDELLRTVANELRVLSDHTVARVGADEFAVVASVAAESALAQAEELAEELQGRLTRPIRLGELTLTIETSIGAAVGPFPPDTSVSLLSVAESNLRRAKTSLARVATSDVRDGEPYEAHLAVVAELRYAIENGNLCLHYQPKVDLTSERVTGVEALVRWDHPRRGLLSPVAFVPLAERTGLIGPLTRFVLREAIGQMARWQEEGLDLSMSVNLGAANLEDPSLPEYLSGLLADFGVEAGKLILEITEGVVMSESERTTSVVNRLDAAGVHLSIDDFGTAHSSLSRLKTLPISEIKLDKAFVTHMDAGWHDVTIVRSSINLGHELGLRVVAEGIETAAVADHLRRLGCDVGQGFWLAHPMSAPEASKWLQATLAPSPAQQA
jgi:diguanylate cyclase (GGDEF)-like protein/PAS domain S-box-containing protein